jgi:hypothetical protein
MVLVALLHGGLVEYQATPTVPDDGRDSVVTLVPVRGEGAAPPMRGTLSVVPALPSVMGHLSLQLSNPLPTPLGLQCAAVWSAATASAVGRTSAWSATAVPRLPQEHHCRARLRMGRRRRARLRLGCRRQAVSS